jgi:hypothetical protein
VYKVCDVQVYIQNGKPSYVISVPLIDKGEFKAYYLIPVPIPVDTGKLLYIRTENSILCVDKKRQYYYFSSDQELRGCKETIEKRYVCKQDKPLLSSQNHEECAVLLLTPQKTLPDSCEVHYVQLNNTVWTQISDTEWIYYVPRKDSITILCADRDPVDAPLMGAGRLAIDFTCKGYSRAALLQPLRSVKTNDSGAKENRLVQVQLNNECCEELGTRVNLSKLNLNLNFRQTISHADDLKYAGITKSKTWKSTYWNTSGRENTQFCIMGTLLSYILLLYWYVYILLYG